MKNKPIEVVAAILYSNRKVLVGKRMKNDSNGGKWEFPGGKIRPDESPEDALKREIMEELGVELSTITFFEQIEHDYSRYSVNIRFYLARVDSNIELAQESHDELQWIHPEESGNLDFLEANKPVMKKLVDLFKS